MKKINEERLIKYLRSLIFRSLIAILLFLILAITSKKEQAYKDIIISNLYEKNFSFTKIKNIYNKYLGGIVPLDKISINNAQLEYSNATPFYDGVKLEVFDKYLVPVIEEGMIVYIGEKEKYGNVIIVEGLDGVEIWYGNMENTTSKLYDYVDKNTYLGQTKNNNLYLIYSKDGNFLNYKEYLKWK